MERSRRHRRVHTRNHTHACAQPCTHSQHPGHVPRHTCTHVCTNTHACTDTSVHTHPGTHSHPHAGTAPRLPTSLLLLGTVEQPLSSISQPFPASMRTQAPAEQPAAPSRGASDEGAGREQSRSWPGHTPPPGWHVLARAPRHAVEQSGRQMLQKPARSPRNYGGSELSR